MVQLARALEPPRRRAGGDGGGAPQAAERRPCSKPWRASRLSFRCLLVGADEDAAGRRELEEHPALGLAERCSSPGTCADMPAAYMLADVVVSASSEPEAFVASSSRRRPWAGRS